MSPKPLESWTPEAANDALLANFRSLYWVIGGCWGDDSRAWRRWSEVCGPYLDRAQAEALRQRMLDIHQGDPRVHFEVVRRDDDEA